MRLIDANQLLDKAICTRNYFEIKSLVESIPTLNEPHCDLLSLGELMSMDGEPIWLEVGPLNEWVIVHSHDPEDVIGGGITVITKAREKLLLQYDKWLTTWKAYRTKQEEKRMTNADKLREMSEEELADFLDRVHNSPCDACCGNFNRCLRNNAPEPVCKRHILEWLEDESNGTV